MIKKLLMMFVATMAATGAWAEIRFGDTYSWRIEKFLDGWYDSEMLKASGVSIYTGPIADAGTETRLLVEIVGASSKNDINPIIENLGFDGALTASVWSDKELRNKAMPSSSTARYWGRESGWIDDRTPGDISNYPGDNCEYNDVGYEYETDDFKYEWPIGLWPNGMTDDGRFWIMVDIKTKKQNCWSGLGNFKVRLSGDDSPSVNLYVTYSPTDIWMNIIGGFSNIFRGIKILNNKSHFLFNIDFYEPWLASYNTPIHNYWADGFVDDNHRVTLELSEAGTLYLSSHWYELIDDDKISGADFAELVEVDELADSEDARSYFFENGTAFPFGAAYWKVKVNSKRKIYIDVGEDDDFEITRMQFFPEHGNSVAVEASWVSLAPESRYQLNENDDIGVYLQGYVTGTGVYKVGETVSLKAIPGPGEEFSHWELMYGNFPDGIDTTKATLNFVVTDTCAGSADERKQMLVKAVWRTLQKPIIQFDANGGEVSELKRIVAKDAAIGVLPTATRSKYKFLGWYTAPEGGTKISATTKVTSDVTYYAQWVYDGSTTISAYVADGCEAMGKVTGGKTAKAGTKLTLKATANKGYVFAGWDGPLDESLDSRNPSVSWVIGEDDAEFTARFVPIAEDFADISFTMPKEIENGMAIENVAIDVSGCTSLPTVKVAGLPSGLKFTAKPIYKKGSKTEIEVPANTIYGTPKKSGVYTVVATVTTAGKKTAKYSQTVIVRKRGEKVVVAECDATGGKVTGGGVYATGKKVTLKATANKGYVFAGWYLDADGLSPVESTVDFRTASLPYVMTAEPETTLYAMFVTAEEDSDIMLYVKDKEITVNANDNNFVAQGTTILPLEMESVSLPKAMVSGLPAGMKYTDKALTVKATKKEEAYDVPANAIYGTPTKPGLYTVTVKLTNTTVKKAIEKKFTIEVPNLMAANGCFIDKLDNGIGKKRILSVGITNLDDFLPSLRLNSPTAKLTVSGLPAGLKYDAKTGKITGVATKPGVYTVTLTVTDGKAKYVSTITIEVEALPDWVVGTFNGYYTLEGYHGPSKEHGVYNKYEHDYTDGRIHWEMAEPIYVKVDSKGKVIFEWPEPGTVVESTGLQREGDGSFSFHFRFREHAGGPYLEYEEGSAKVVFYRNETLSKKNWV